MVTRVLFEPLHPHEYEGTRDVDAEGKDEEAGGSKGGQPEPEAKEADHAEPDGHGDLQVWVTDVLKCQRATVVKCSIHGNHYLDFTAEIRL